MVAIENENKGSRKREWIKNIAIIFLTIMLILTFFSNTIMNYSLPQVATRYVESGSISAQIRGTGTVEAVDPYNVVVNESRVVSSVAVKVDAFVEKGDVLYYLEDRESAELETARAELAAAKLAYDKAILNGGLTRSEVAEIENGYVESVTQSQARLEAADAKIEELQHTVNVYQANVNATQARIDTLATSKIDASSETKALAQAEINLNNGNAELAQAQSAYDMVSGLPDGDPVKTDAAIKLQAAQNKVSQLTAAVSNARVALELKTGSADITNQIAELEKQKVGENNALAAAQINLENAIKEKEEMLNEILVKMDIADAYKTIQDKEALVAELEADSVGAAVTAPVSGTVTSLAYTAGETIVAGEAAAVIQIEGKGYIMTLSVPNKQASTVKVGDPVELQNAWYYDDVTATLTDIRNDKANPGQNKILEFQLTGDSLVPGQSLSVSIGQRSVNYDLIVPNSAIREDNNGKFILIVESKFAPFGNRYVAQRVDVEVIASDDTQSAIKGGLYGYEYVITTSTKPIESGDQVRLSEEMN